jgi:hypothetical protein
MSHRSMFLQGYLPSRLPSFSRLQDKDSLMAWDNSMVCLRSQSQKEKTLSDVAAYKTRLVHIEVDTACIDFLHSNPVRTQVAWYDWTLQDAFKEYQQTGKSPWCSTERPIPSNISQVVAELQLTMDYMMASKRFLPAWMVMPRDQSLRREANKLGEEFHDPGNQLFEALFHAAGLEQLFEGLLRVL